MDRTDVLKIMAVLRGAYPQFYRNISKQEAEDTVNLWLDLFGGEPYPLVAAAVKSFISSDEEGFPPVPGKIMGRRTITRRFIQTSTGVSFHSRLAVLWQRHFLYRTPPCGARLPERCTH